LPASGPAKLPPSPASGPAKLPPSSPCGSTSLQPSRSPGPSSLHASADDAVARERAAGDDVERRGTRRDTPARDGARRRVLLVAAPLVLVALCALDLVVRGRSAVDVVATNLASQPASRGVRVIDRVRPTAPAGRVYRVVVTPAATAAAAAPTHDAT